MDRLFEDSFARLPRLVATGVGEFPLDVYQTENELVVKAALPGVKPEELDITIADNTLTIKGEHQEEQEAKENDYLHRERSYGTFSRTVAIPVKVNSEKAEATFEEGVLTLTLPKAGEIKPRQLKIKPKAAIKEAPREAKKENRAKKAKK